MKGKSFSEKNPKGIRRKINGKELAPRSLRKKGKKLLNDRSDKELKAGGILYITRQHINQ